MSAFKCEIHLVPLQAELIPILIPNLLYQPLLIQLHVTRVYKEYIEGGHSNVEISYAYF